MHTLKVARIHHAGAGINAREATASALLELGADIYYGHSAHICQDIEIYRGKPILYDTGDFIDDYAVDPMLHNDRSCLFKVMFEKGQLQRIELIPMILEVAHVALTRGEDFKAISARMEMLCAEFGNRLMRRDDRLVYEVSHAMG